MPPKSNKRQLPTRSAAKRKATSLPQPIPRKRPVKKEANSGKSTVFTNIVTQEENSKEKNKRDS